ncbi:DUF4256 domain-containing protein [Salegentibacter flavus]|nr:DUF4256 domain-containing protein [Salegentibacter flavus]
MKQRFEAHPEHHKGIKWTSVENRLKEAHGEKLRSLYQMESTGGEPDVVDQDKETREIIFFDCSERSPKGRRSLCYDRAALEARKAHKPKNSAMDLAREMGVELLSRYQYRQLQQFGDFDTKTSSWVQTPENIRELCGALFCDKRYDTVFLYHSGAASYYASRGFRASLQI